MFVLTIDQKGSRRGTDAVPELLRRLSGIATVAGFSRTVGDEIQGLLADPAAVRTAILRVLRDGGWHIGLGVGPVEEGSWSDGVTSGRGAAFLAAREAVESAKRSPSNLAVRSDAARERAAECEAAWHLVAELVDRRTDAQWRVVDAAEGGAAGVEIAESLGVTPQSVSDSLRRSGIGLERAAHGLLDRLAAETDAEAVRAAGDEKEGR